jgi:hypothetical protein
VGPLGFGIVGLEYLWLGLTPASGPVVSFQFPDCHFVARSTLYIGSLLFFSKKSFAFVFFLWVVSTCVLICLMLLMDEFSSLIFIYRVFSSSIS